MLLLASASLAVGLVTALNAGLMQIVLGHYTDSYANSNFIIGAVLGLGMFLGVIIPPVIGTWSDNTTTRFGRRRPYLFVFVPLTAIMLALLSIFGDPSIIHTNTFSPLAFYLLILCYVVMNIFYNVWNAPYYAFYADLTCEKDRGECSGYFQAFSIIGTISAFMIGYAVWDSYPVLTFLIIAAAAGASSGITTLFVKEPPEALNNKPAQKFPLSEIFREFIHEKDFAMFMYTSAFWWFAMGMLQVFFVRFATKELNTSESDAQLIMGIFTIILIVSAIPFGILSDKIGKKLILRVGLVIASASLFTTFFMTNITAIMVLMGFTGAGFGVVVVLNMALTADLLPKGKEGKFMGLGNVFMALPQSLAAVLGGAVISAFGNNLRLIFIMGPLSLVFAFLLLQRVKVKRAECAEDKAKPADAGSGLK